MALAWRCKRWASLPESGAIFDQPLATMVRMEAAEDTYNAFKSRALAENAVEWSKRHPEWTEYCQTIDELRFDD